MNDNTSPIQKQNHYDNERALLFSNELYILYSTKQFIWLPLQARDIDKKYTGINDVCIKHKLWTNKYSRILTLYIINDKRLQVKIFL